MYQPVHLDGFLRLLVSHLCIVVDEGERLLDFYSDQARITLLLQAIDNGEDAAIEEHLALRADYEALFALQVSHAREWVDRLGQLDVELERDGDEFLAATYAVERLLRDKARERRAYEIENRLDGAGRPDVLRADLRTVIDVETIMMAIYELLARLDEHYELMDDLLNDRQIVNGVPFGPRADAEAGCKIIPLFGDKSVS